MFFFSIAGIYLRSKQLQTNQAYSNFDLTKPKYIDVIAAILGMLLLFFIINPLPYEADKNFSYMKIESNFTIKLDSCMMFDFLLNVKFYISICLIVRNYVYTTSVM